MASTATVVPAPGHVDAIHRQLMAVLEGDKAAQAQSAIEDVRQARFVLRKFFYSMIELTTSGSRTKDAYLEAARIVGTVDGAVPGDGNIAERTAVALYDILEEAPWGLEQGVAPEKQSLNVSIKGIKDGINAAIDSLSETLREDGTEELEYEEVSPVSSLPKTPSKNRRPHSASTPSRTPGSGPGNFNHDKGRKWTDVENLEILKVIRDLDEGTHKDRRDEFNRRMAASSAAQGVPPETPRTKDAWRQQVKKLRAAGTTIADVEQALGIMANEDEQDG